MSGVFGKASFGGKGRTWFKIKDGNNGPYRILPPMGDLADDGRWSAYYNIHYGYKNSEGKMRTFQSPLIKNRKTKMIESPDAALDRINQLKVKLDEAKKAGNNEMYNKLLELVGGKKSRYNLDSNHYLNVIDLQGNIGILKIRHRAKLALDAKIKELRDSGVEPLDPETGRFFVFSRSGMAMDTIYQVSLYQEKLNIDGVGEVKRDVVHKITEDIARRCLVQNKDGSFTYKEAARLDRLFKTPTSEEVDRIVREGEKAVDEILDTATNENVVDTDESGFEDEETAPVQAATVAAPSQVTTQPVQVSAESVTAPSTSQTTPGTYNAEPAATQQSTTPVVSSAPAVVDTTPKTTAQTTAGMTDEEFLKDLGL